MQLLISHSSPTTGYFIRLRMLWLIYHCTIAYFYWTHNFNKNSLYILHTNCYCTYFNLCRMTCRMLQVFFFFFILLYVFGRCRETMTGENSRGPVPPHCRPAVYGAGLQTWHYGQAVAAEGQDGHAGHANNIQDLFFFLFFFLFLFLNNPPTPNQKKKNEKQKVILLPWVVGWADGGLGNDVG